MFGPRIGCPEGAFPIALDAYINKVPVTGQKGISALGMVCARPG